VKNIPRNHWLETGGWEMDKHLHGCILATLKAVVQSARIISISADEVTTLTTLLGWRFICMLCNLGKRCLIYFICLVFLRVILLTT
jgi:hypothetical protein